MSKNIVSSHGIISNVNEEKLKDMKKIKLINRRIITLTVASMLFLSGFFMAKNLAKKAEAEQAKKAAITAMMEDQVLTTVTIETEPGDSVSKLASEYYDSEYKGFYDTKSKYEEAIMEENDMKSSKLDVGIEIELPVVVDKNDPNYLKILEIEQKIKDIESNNLWVRYKVKSGDSISKLASLASGSYDETYDITQQIYLKNHISKNDSILNIGDEIWIMNPELGTLKAELNAAEQILAESLENGPKAK